MNQIRFTKLTYVLLLFVLVACQAQATSVSTTAPPLATAIPATVTLTATPALTAKPSAAPVIAEWKVSNPSFIAFGFGSVWVTDHYGHNITRIDPVSNKVIAVIQGTGSNPEQALEVGDLLWVSGQANDATLIDPITNTLTKSTLKGGLLFMAFGFNSVWITTRGNTLDRIDPATSEVIASIPLEDGNSDCMNEVLIPVLVTAAAVWVTQCDKAELIKIDPLTNSVVAKTPYATLIDEAKTQTTIPAGKGTDFIWVMAWDGIEVGLLRVDPTTGAGLTFLPLSPAQSGDGFIAVTDEAVWLAGNGQINRVNVATNQIDATYSTASGRLKIGVDFGSVWLRNYEKNLIQRLDVAP